MRISPSTEGIPEGGESARRLSRPVPFWQAEPRENRCSTASAELKKRRALLPLLFILLIIVSGRWMVVRWLAVGCLMALAMRIGRPHRLDRAFLLGEPEMTAYNAVSRRSRSASWTAPLSQEPGRCS